MNKLSRFQLYCMLLILTAPLAFLEQPHLLIHHLLNNSWMAVLASSLPGLLLIYIYVHIIKKSTRPFPLLLSEHLGKTLGWILGLVYIPAFLLVSAYTLRLFIEFMKMNVLPATPISIFIGVLLFVGFYALKSGIENIARVSELAIFAGLPFSILVVIAAIVNNFHPNRLLPLANMDYKSLGMGVLNATYVFGYMMPVLSLAFFLDKKDQAHRVMNQVLITYIPLITLTTMGIILTRGDLPSLGFTFPTFSMVRLARIGAFIQNIDIFYISVLILGVFSMLTLTWFMACFTTQKLFGLKDYRFLAAPSALIIGITAILIGANNLEVTLWSRYIIPPLYSLLFIVIPLLVFAIALFKPQPHKIPTESQDSHRPEASG